MDKKIKVTRTMEFGLDALIGLFDIAYYGGINYWSERVGQNTPKAEYDKLAIKLEQAGDKSAQSEMDALLILEGWHVHFELHDEAGVHALTAQKIITALQKLDDEEYADFVAEKYDADLADKIIQYALFNELVYG